ncbi:MAG: hypothetical protein AMJ56_15480, partial [Anaerolineae bacterium SG8_19]
MGSGIILAMSGQVESKKGAWRDWTWILPAMISALFTGRLLNEWLRWGVSGAILITLAAFLLAFLLMRRRPIQQTWPACLLVIYVIYPEPDPRVALAVALLAIAALILSLTSNGTEQFISSRLMHIIPILLIAASFSILYFFTLTPDILPADSGEFQLVAAELGVAHPPGFPLYTMLANLMTRLPLEATAAYKVNLLSVITSVLTLILVYLAVYQLTGSIAAGIVGSLALGGATTFWAQATTANIRSLTGFFTALALYALLKTTGYRISSLNQESSVLSDSFTNNLIDPDSSRWTRVRRIVSRIELSNWFSTIRNEPPSTQEHISQKNPPIISRTFFLALFFLAIGLGITHHGSLVFIAAFFILFLLLVQPNSMAPRRWPIILLAAGVGLATLLYLPIRGAAGAFGAPDDLTSMGGFLNHVLARGFRGDLLYFDDLGILWERLKVMGNVFAFQFHPFLLAAIVAGMAIMIWRDRFLALLIGGSMALFILVAAIYRAPQTVEYLLPAYVLAVVSIGYLAGIARQEGLTGKVSRTNRLIRRYLASILIALLFVT